MGIRSSSHPSGGNQSLVVKAGWPKWESVEGRNIKGSSTNYYNGVCVGSGEIVHEEKHAHTATLLPHYHTLRLHYDTTAILHLHCGSTHTGNALHDYTSGSNDCY